MKTIDLTKYGRQNVSFYLALERYILNASEWLDEELFFIWDIHPAIVCGKHQLIEGEVNMEYVRKIGVPIYRRHSGGGTIFADEGCFMFTFIKRSGKRDDVFRECLSSVVKAFGEIGLETELSGRNDLLFKGKKFSGNAYYRNENGSILHGTLLYKTDIEQLVRTITPDNEKLISKGIESVRQRVINVGDYMTLGREELMRHLSNAQCRMQNAQLKETRDTRHETRDDKQFVIYLSEEDYNNVKSIEPDYLTDEWLWGNNPPYTFKNKQRFAWGGIEVRLDVKNGRIKSVEFNGDFFTHQDLKPLYDSFVDVDFQPEAIREVLNRVKVEEYILGATTEDILSLVETQ